MPQESRLSKKLKRNGLSTSRKTTFKKGTVTSRKTARVYHRPRHYKLHVHYGG